MPEPNIGDRNSYGSCVHKFRAAKLRRGSRTFAQDQVRRGWSNIITIFQWVLIFEQSVNHDADRDGGRKLARLRRGLRRIASNVEGGVSNPSARGICRST